MTKSQHLRRACLKLEEAIVKLKIAKHELLVARSDQHVPLAVQLAALEEIHDILNDPECTPEIAEPVEDDDDDPR